MCRCGTTTYCAWTRIVRFLLFHCVYIIFVLSRFCTPFDRRHLFGAWAQKKKRETIWLLSLRCVGRFVMAGAGAACIGIIHQISRLYISSRLRCVSIFFSGFMIALRARWNSRDQLTDNYHIALIRSYFPLDIYFIAAEKLIQCLHAIDMCVVFITHHSQNLNSHIPEVNSLRRNQIKKKS